MAWHTETKPTRINVRRRLDSALETLRAAEALNDRRIGHKAGDKRGPLENAIDQAGAWTQSAMRLLDAQAGKRAGRSK